MDDANEVDVAKLAAYKRISVKAGETISIEIPVMNRAWCTVDATGSRTFAGKGARVTASLLGINPCEANDNGNVFVR